RLTCSIAHSRRSPLRETNPGRDRGGGGALFRSLGLATGAAERARRAVEPTADRRAGGPLAERRSDGCRTPGGPARTEQRRAAEPAARGEPIRRLALCGPVPRRAGSPARSCRDVALAVPVLGRATGAAEAGRRAVEPTTDRGAGDPLAERRSDGCRTPGGPA